MRGLKRFTAIIMTILMMLNAVACGKVDERTKAAKELDISQPITVNVWYNDKAYESYLRFVAVQFKNSNELVTIKPIYIDQEEYVEYIYNESIKNDNACDLYLLSSEEVEKAYLMGLMLENKAYTDIYTEKVFGKAAITACSFRDKLYGYPMAFNTAFLIYNADYADEVENFEQIEKISNTFQVNDENAHIKMVFNWAPSSMFLNYAFGGYYMNVGGENAENSASLTVNDTNMKNAMTKYAQLRDKMGISKNTTLDECVEMFSNGELLYTIVDADNLETIAESNVNYAISPFPNLDGTHKSRAMSVTDMMVVNPYTQNIKVSEAVARAFSYDYADFMTTYSDKCCARGDIKVEGNSAAYESLHNIYSNSIVKAKCIGVGEAYMRYEILIHQVWDGADIEKAYEDFSTVIKKVNTVNKQ